MLQSKFAKKSQDFKAQKIFTDRKEPRAVFRDSIAEFDEVPRRIINYYGKGGVGKTTLLRNIVLESGSVYAEYKKKSITNIFVSLDAFEYSNPVNILTAIRNGIKGDCTLFDYAMTQYYAKARMTIDEIKNKNKFISDTVMSMLNEVASIATANICVPMTMIGKLASLIKDAYIKEKYKQEIKEIASLNEFDIFERLPYYLGICINNAARKGKYHVVFLDSYESLLNRTVGGTPSVKQEEWLQEFFLSCDSVRIVIASRDRMRWDKQDAEWSEFLDRHRLDDLSDEDSRWFLEHVPIAEPDVIDAIVKRTAGAPLYLDMCVDIYESNKNAGTPFDPDSIASGELIVDRYMRHLTSKDRYAVKVIAVPRRFTVEFAQELLRRQNLGYTIDELYELMEKSVFVPIDEQNKVFKVDESVRNNLMSRLDTERKTDILEDILDCILAENGASVYPYFGSALETLIQNPPCFDKLYGKIFGLVDFYANAGYWRELHALLGKHVGSDSKKLAALAVVNEITYLRRSGDIHKALGFISSHPIDAPAMDEWAYLYKYLCIQINHLSGRYDESIAAYKALLDEMDLVRHTVPTHVYTVVALKYADLLFLKGDFAESLARTEQMLQSAELSVDDRLELIRLKGHNYRFRRQPAEAQAVYMSALKLIEENNMRIHLGKLYTNMTETLCTVNPLQAIEWYKKSVEENGATENAIELGKTYAAGAVAYAKAGDADTGLELAQRALDTATESGYNSGRAFALAAQAYVLSLAGKKAESEQCYKKLTALLAELNVYKYIAEWFK